MSEKKAIRNEVKVRLAALSADTRAGRDRALCERALAFPEFAAAKTVMAYMPLPDEPDLRPLLRRILAEGKTLGLPRVGAGGRSLRQVGQGQDDRLPRVGAGGEMSCVRVDDLDAQLAPGALGILEPVAGLPELDPAALDLIIVPGRAFALSGERLGRGGGYYDRFLARVRGYRLALCYDEQLYAKIPAAAHDLPVDAIVTPTRSARCGEQAQRHKGT